MLLLLVAVHVMANVVWIGAIASVGWLTRHAAALAEPEGRPIARAAYELLYLRAAVPAFIVSFLAGVGRLAADPKTYFSLHWFHGKLFFALAVIGVHHVLGARAKKAAGGSMQGAESSAILTGALLVATFLVIVFAVFKGSLVT
jgi:protoporphyrinogen IX oxidase